MWVKTPAEIIHLYVEEGLPWRSALLPVWSIRRTIYDQQRSHPSWCE